MNATTFTYYIPSLALANATGTITATTSDQFNFAYEPVTGNAFIAAQLTSLTNGDGAAGTPQAGLMFRSTTDPASPFVAILQTSANQLIFESRSTSGGAISSTTLNSIPIGSEFLELVRTGNNFIAYYSSNGNSWTQLGSSISIAAMPTTANAGLAVSANFNSQLASATFASVVAGNAPSALLSNNQLTYTFPANASAFLSQSSLSLQPIISGAAISPTGYSYNATNNTATFTLPAGIAAGIYQATLLNQSFTFLTTASSATFALPGTGQTYTVQQLFLAPNSTLDIGNDSLIIQYTGTSPVLLRSRPILPPVSTPANGTAPASSPPPLLPTSRRHCRRLLRHWLNSHHPPPAGMATPISMASSTLTISRLFCSRKPARAPNRQIVGKTAISITTRKLMRMIGRNSMYAVAYSHGQTVPAFSEALFSNDFISQLLQ